MSRPESYGALGARSLASRALLVLRTMAGGSRQALGRVCDLNVDHAVKRSLILTEKHTGSEEVIR